MLRHEPWLDDLRLAILAVDQTGLMSSFHHYGYEHDHAPHWFFDRAAEEQGSGDLRPFSLKIFAIPFAGWGIGLGLAGVVVLLEIWVAE